MAGLPSSQPFRVTLLDDDSNEAARLGEALREQNVIVEQFVSDHEIISYLSRYRSDLLLFNLAVEKFDPLAFLERVIAVSPETKIVMGIQKNRRALALDFLRQGVSDIIEAPWSFEDLVFHIRKHQAQPTRRLTRGISELGFDGIVGRSKEISAVFDTIARVAPFDTTLLITGSSGTGKELVAQAIHRNSKRKNKPFVAINCGAIPEHLIESELFGHKKGAFTDALYDKKGLFEEANGGTIFLDEIAELSPQLQVKLLRVLQERSFQAVGDSQVRNVDVRVVAATLSDLEKSIRAGSFREDLYYRLHVVHIQMPDLCRRSDDIPLLIDFFLAKHGRRLGIPVPQVDEEALALLASYQWPGNVRELENCIERALVMHEGGVIRLQDLPKKLREASEDSDMPNILNNDSLSIKEHMRRIERYLITQALKETHGNRTRAAKLLEISHRSLLYKVKEYDLSDIGKSSF